MDKIFLSYKFTGVDPTELENNLGLIEESLQNIGHEVFCSLSLEQYFRDNNMTYDEIVDYCLEIQKQSNVFMAFINHSDPSGGMSKELEKAKNLGQKIILCIKKGLEYVEFRKAASKTIEFTTVYDLCDTLSNKEI